MRDEDKGPSIEGSPRFQPPPSRRDFLGMAAVWSAVATLGTALLGALRLPMPSVFPESQPRVKIGPPGEYPVGSATQISDLRLWLYHDQKGMYAISAICTHLGCTVARDPNGGGFHCPCHGSVFTADGKVIGGPAPRPLDWLALSRSPDGQLVVDTMQTVPLGTHFEV